MGSGAMGSEMTPYPCDPVSLGVCSAETACSPCIGRKRFSTFGCSECALSISPPAKEKVTL